MKIGILTFHRSINYGAFLQSYALSKFIKNLDPSFEVEIIDFQYKRSHYNYLKGIFVSTDYFGQYRNYKRYHAFARALRTLPMSDKFLDDDASKAVGYINSKYDVVITGSDAVFGNKPLPNIFWQNGINVRHKASYAASAYGRDFNSIPEQQLKLMGASIESMGYIGVRDNETAKMLMSANEKKRVYRNCDPSIFLDLSDFENGLVNARKINIPVGQKKVIGTMLHDNYINKRIKERYGKTHLIVSLYRHNPYADIYLYDLNPFEWAKVFAKFEILITKYFHGSIFCLKNNVPVIALDYSKHVDTYCCKLNDLFSKLDISDYYFKRKDIRTDNDVKKVFEVVDSVLLDSKDLRNKIYQALENEKTYVESFHDYLTTL